MAKHRRRRSGGDYQVSVTELSERILRQRQERKARWASLITVGPGDDR